MRINTIRFKISILYTIILGIILVIYSGILYLSLQWTLYDDLDDELKVKAKAVSDTINSYTDTLGSDKETFLLAAKMAINKETEFSGLDKITELERQWAQKRDKLDMENDYIGFLSPKSEITIGADNDSFMNLRVENRNLRVISRPIFYNGERYIVQISTSLKPIMEILKDRLNSIVAAIPVILIFTSLIGRFLVAKILEPVKQITRTAKKITHEDLSARVETEQVDDEMRYLVVTFNDMIKRLENSFKYISEFSSHVAHELKTPLAIIRGETELTLRKERTPNEYKRVLQGNLDEVCRILKIIDDLFLLTRLQHQREIFTFEKFVVEQFLRELFEQSRLLASRKNISVDFNLPERDTVISADRIHLRRLFFNLVNNAVKFTPEGGAIKILADYGNKKTFVSISDTGIGIPEEDLPKIFDKFFRINNPNLNFESGSGLGLNIALEIARIHGGDITVKSELGKGSIFTVSLPYE